MVEILQSTRFEPLGRAGVEPHEATPALPDGVLLRAPEDSHPLDWHKIACHLAQHGLALDESVPARQFAGGLANLNYLVRLSEGWFVLRRPPDGPLPPGANDMRREHKILSRLGSVLTFAPRSLHLCEDASVAGAPFQIVEFRPGIAVRGDDLAPFSHVRDVERRLADMMVETLASIHRVDMEAVGLGGLGRPEGFFRRTAKGWIDRAERVAGGELSPATAHIARWLERVPDPAAGDATLLHNDFKLDNILLDPSSLRPVAVVDWDMGTRGDALFDLATLLSYWSEAGDPACMQQLGQMPTARPGFPDRAAVAAAYQERTSRSVSEIKPYRILTMLKLGVVFQQLHARFLAKETQDQRYAAFGTLGDELHEFTMDIVNDKIF